MLYSVFKNYKDYWNQLQVEGVQPPFHLFIGTRIFAVVYQISSIKLMQWLACMHVLSCYDLMYIYMYTFCNTLLFFLGIFFSSPIIPLKLIEIIPEYKTPFADSVTLDRWHQQE